MKTQEFLKSVSLFVGQKAAVFFVLVFEYFFSLSFPSFHLHFYFLLLFFAALSSSETFLPPAFIFLFGIVQDYLYGTPIGYFPVLSLSVHTFFSFCKPSLQKRPFSFQIFIFLFGLLFAVVLSCVLSFFAFQNARPLFFDKPSLAATVIFYGLSLTMRGGFLRWQKRSSFGS